MSTPPHTRWLGSLSTGARRFDVPIAVGLMFTFGLSGLAYFVNRGVPYDLRLQLPSAALAGDSVGMRAAIFDRSGDAPRLVQGHRASVTLQVPCAVEGCQPRTITEAQFQEDANGGLEATVRLEDIAPGDYEVRAQAEGAAPVSAPLRVGDAVSPGAMRERPTLPLQAFSVFPIRAEAGHEAPEPLEPRVPGGACAPLVPCEVLVRVGEPAAAVRLVSTPAFEPPPGATHNGVPPGVWSETTSDIVSLLGVPHGADVELELEAARGGVKVGARTFRLPMVLGGTLGRVMGEGERSRVVTTVSEGTPVFVDVFRSGRWVAATSFLAEADGVPLTSLSPPIARSAEPLRLQIRLDPFSTSNAVTQITGSNELSARFDRALDELRVVEIPPPVSSYRQAEHRLAADRSRVRWLVVGAVLIAGTCAVALVIRRGIIGAAYARRAHAAAGGDGSLGPRLWAGVLVAAAAVAVAFASAAAWFAWRTAVF